MVAKSEDAPNPAAFWRQIRKMTTKRPRPLTIQDGNGRTLETEHQIAGAFAQKLEKQFQISEEEDTDFDSHSESTPSGRIENHQR